MENQLVGRYLKDNHCKYGIYLVGWFNCTRWFNSDDRKQRAEKLCPNLRDTRQKLDKAAADLSKASIRVQSVVLDTSLH
jgi:hypothetical protein